MVYYKCSKGTTNESEVLLMYTLHIFHDDYPEFVVRFPSLSSAVYAARFIMDDSTCLGWTITDTHTNEILYCEGR